MQSNSDTEFINELYEIYKIHHIILVSRNIKKRMKIPELLIGSHK